MTPIDDELLSAYIDGELTREERTVVSGLVQSEPRWKARLEAFQKDGESFRKLPARELTESARVRAFQQKARPSLQKAMDSPGCHDYSDRSHPRLFSTSVVHVQALSQE